MYYVAIQHNTIWCLESGMWFLSWFRAWEDDQHSGQRQKEYGTWEASEGNLEKSQRKKKKKEQTNKKEKKRKERTKEKLQHAGWKEEKREKTRTDQQRRT